MKEDRSYTQKYAMTFGTYMGLYWIAKFILFPLAFNAPFLSLLYLLFTLAVPFLGYYYAKQYRDKYCEGTISFLHALIFTILLYLFASLLVSVAHYVYFQYIDHGYIADTYSQLWDRLMTTSPELVENKEIIEEMKQAARSLSPLDITIQCIGLDILWGCIFAFPTALAVMRKENSANGQPFVQF